MKWEQAIIKVIEDNNNQPTHVQHIYKHIGIYIDLNERNNTVDLDYGNRPMYQHAIRGHIGQMRKKGILETTGRGLYKVLK